MEGNYMLSCLVFFPMAGAILTYLIGRRNKTARDYAADCIVIVEFAAMLFVFCIDRKSTRLNSSHMA